MQYIKILGVALLFLAPTAVAAQAEANAPSEASLGLPAITSPTGVVATPAQVELGRKLFLDRRLSPNNTMSCAMCHIPEQAFVVNTLSTAVGINGRSVKRNAPTLLNVAFNRSLFWDGRERSLDALAWQPLLHPKEMGNPSVQSVLSKIESLPDYRGAFEAAFAGEHASRDTVGRALGAYQRTLVAGDSRFDRWYYGKKRDALTPQEQAGFRVFNDVGCAACHRYDEASALFTDHAFHNTGIGWRAAQKDKTYTVPLAPGVETQISERELDNVTEPLDADDGRFEATHDAQDRYRYRTPSLRNVALTAPYMHDGSLRSLPQVIDFYAAGGLDNPGRDARLRPFTLSAQDRAALIAFLRSLSSAHIDALAHGAREPAN